MVLPAHSDAPTAAAEPVCVPWWTTAVSLIALCAVLLVASFLQPDPARNDFERFGDLRLLFLFFAVFAGLSAAYIATYTQRQPLPLRLIIGICVACAALLLASFPVGSKDALGYAFLGRMWGVYHANPYVVPPTQFASDPWQPALARTLRRTLSVYGPLFMWQSWLINAGAGDSMWLAVWLHKACATGLLLTAVWLTSRILKTASSETAAPPAWLLTLVAWNPLFLFEAAGSGHNDIAMVVLLLAAVWSWRARRHAGAMGLLALSFWYKPYSVIFIPVFLLEELKAAGGRAALRLAAIGAAIGLVTGALLLWPLPGALSAILTGLLHPEKLHGIYPNELSPVLAALFWALRATGLFDTDLGFRIFDLSRFALFAGAVSAILLRQWRATPSYSGLVESCFLVGLTFFLLMVTQLWPWHLLSVIAFAVLCGREPFLLAAVVLTVLGLLSYFLTFAVATVMLGSTAGAVWLLRRFRPAAQGRSP